MSNKCPGSTIGIEHFADAKPISKSKSRTWKSDQTYATKHIIIQTNADWGGVEVIYCLSCYKGK